MSFIAKAWRALTCAPARMRGRCSSVLPSPNLDCTQVELQKPFLGPHQIYFCQIAWCSKSRVYGCKHNLGTWRNCRPETAFFPHWEATSHPWPSCPCLASRLGCRRQIQSQTPILKSPKLKSEPPEVGTFKGFQNWEFHSKKPSDVLNILYACFLPWVLKRQESSTLDHKLQNNSSRTESSWVPILRECSHLMASIALVVAETIILGIDLTFSICINIWRL